MTKLPPNFTDAQWNALNGRQRAAAWTAVISGLYKGLRRIVVGTPFSAERFKAATSAIKEAAEARADCLKPKKKTSG